MDELKIVIQQQLSMLLCETHEGVCALRDSDLSAAVGKVLAVINSYDKAISVQSAIAELELTIQESRA
jgi:hypothetical protein